MVSPWTWRWSGKWWIGAWTGSGSVSASTSGVLDVSRKSSADPSSETRLNTRRDGLLRLDRGGRRALDDRLGEGAIGVCTFGAAGVLQDRHAGQRRLRKPDAVLDDDVENDVAIALANQLQHFLRVQRPRLMDGGQDAADAKLRVELGPHALDRVVQELHALHAEVLALERDDDLVRGHQRVDAEQAEGGRAVDHHEVVLVLAGRELLLEEGFAAHLRDELDLGAGELDVRGDEVDPEVAVLDDVAEGDLGIEEQVIKRELDLIGLLEAHVDRQVALRIEVDEEDTLAELSERASQVHRGGRFANAAFLVGNCDDSAQTVARPLCWNVAAAI